MPSQTSWVRTRDGHVPAAKRPLSEAGALRRGVPFAAVAVIAIAVELMTSSSASNPTVLAATAITMGVLLIAAVGVPWGRLPAWTQATVPVGFFVVVVLLRQARGGDTAGYPPLVMLPIIWIAMYGTRRQLGVAIAALAATFVGPLVLLGPPLYPVSGWGVAVLSIAIGALAGPAIQGLVEQARQRTADVAALGTITRALTAGSDPRPQLCDAAVLVAGAGFALLFEPTAGSTLVATAGSRGLDLAELQVDPRTETSVTAQVWSTGKRLYIADAIADPRASARLNELTGAVGLLIQPVTRDGKRTAVLVVGFTRYHPRVPAPVLEMVELVAAELAAAIDRADLVALLAAQARTDPLTGAANRRSWDETMVRELARAERTGEPLAVALIDMDHFKAYNDSCGHTAGDELLRELVTAFRAELRTGDVVARWGGEEFALALPACDGDQALAIAARLLGVIPSGQTASIGLTQATVADTPRSIIGRADRALYAAKDAGRDRVVVLPAAALPPVTAS